MKILIKNGLIIKGDLTKPFIGDVLIYDEKIIEVGKIETDADKIIDAKGRIVSPGFIDTHSHSDLYIMLNPHNEIKIRQGITTEILGQDGRSMAPLPKGNIKEWRKINSAFNGDSDDIDWSYETTKNYLNILEENGIGLNQGYLVPHGNIRLEAVGLENKSIENKDIDKMKDIVKRELEGGAIGLSTGLIYSPCNYANTEELIEICKVIAEYNGIFAVHQRSEADDLINSMKEVIRIGRESGVKIHFSHFKVCGKKNWHYLDEAFKLLEDAKQEGINVSLDQYPYVSGSTSLGVILPPWVHEGGVKELLKRLEVQENRDQIIKDIKIGIKGWDNFVEFAGLDQIFITSVNLEKNKKFIGKNLMQVGEIMNKDPLNATFDLIYEEENRVNMVDFYGLEEHIIKILKRPEQNVCTDGMISDNPHPRLYGSFPRILSRYVREQKNIKLEEAIYKMSKKPAETFRIHNRGEIKEGCYADIVIFDLDKVEEKGTYIDSKQYPQGIDYVIVNGKVIIEDGKHNKVLAGKIIRR